MESRRISRGATTSAAQSSGSQYARSNEVPYQHQPAFVNPQSAPTYTNPPNPPLGFGDDKDKKLSNLEKNVH